MSDANGFSFKRHITKPLTAKQIEDSLNLTDEDREAVRRVLELMPIPEGDDPDTAPRIRAALKRRAREALSKKNASKEKVDKKKASVTKTAAKPARRHAR